MCSPMIRTINRYTKRPHQDDNFIAVLMRHIVSVRWFAGFRSADYRDQSDQRCLS